MACPLLSVSRGTIEVILCAPCLKGPSRLVVFIDCVISPFVGLFRRLRQACLPQASSAYIMFCFSMIPPAYYRQAKCLYLFDVSWAEPTCDNQALSKPGLFCVSRSLPNVDRLNTRIRLLTTRLLFWPLH